MRGETYHRNYPKMNTLEPANNPNSVQVVVCIAAIERAVKTDWPVRWLLDDGHHVHHHKKIIEIIDRFRPVQKKCSSCGSCDTSLLMALSRVKGLPYPKYFPMLKVKPVCRVGHTLTT